MAKIYAPNKQYSGISASVAFAKGVGETDNPALIDWFKEHGYTVEDEELKEPDQTKDNPPLKLEDMDLEQLKVYAEENQIDLGQASSVAGILKKIADAENKVSGEEGEQEV